MKPGELTRRAVLGEALGVLGVMATACSRPTQSAQTPDDPSISPPVAHATPVERPAGQTRLDAGQEPARPEASPGGEAARRPLLERYPGIAERLPWIDLGGLPTPVHRAAALGERLGIERLWIKCDDRAGSDYGGSKARKLEHVLAEALRREVARVITFGGVGSNHTLATAFHARRLGLDCTLMLLHEPPSEHAQTHLLAEHRLGCELVPASAADVRDVEREGDGGRGDARAQVIPMGGTSPMGNAGYVNAAFELAAQCEAGLLPIPDVIYVALGTAGTAAGLFVGLRAVGLATRLVAVRASNPGTGSLRNVRAEIEATARFLHELDPSFPEIEVTEATLHLEHGFAGPGYAIPTPAGAGAAELANELERIELDSTYTAKALASLVNDAPRYAGQTVLFWNTYDPRPVAAGGSSPDDLPPALRRYFNGRARSG